MGWWMEVSDREWRVGEYKKSQVVSKNDLVFLAPKSQGSGLRRLPMMELRLR